MLITFALQFILSFRNTPKSRKIISENSVLHAEISVSCNRSISKDMTVQSSIHSNLVVIHDNLSLIHLRDEGIDSGYFGVLQSYAGLSKSALAYYVGVDPTTVDNYRKRKKKFTGDSAEKLLKLHRLFALGEELFGTTEEFLDWLYLPSPGLEGQKPCDILHSITGMGEIEKQLGRIVHGYVA